MIWSSNLIIHSLDGLKREIWREKGKGGGGGTDVGRSQTRIHELKGEREVNEKQKHNSICATIRRCHSLLLLRNETDGHTSEVGRLLTRAEKVRSQPSLADEGISHSVAEG